MVSVALHNLNIRSETWKWPRVSKAYPRREDGYKRNKIINVLEGVKVRTKVCMYLCNIIFSQFLKLGVLGRLQEDCKIHMISWQGWLRSTRNIAQQDFTSCDKKKVVFWFRSKKVLRQMKGFYSLPKNLHINA